MFCNMCDTRVCVYSTLGDSTVCQRMCPVRLVPAKFLTLKEQLKTVQLSRQGKSARQILLIKLSIGTTQIENVYQTTKTDLFLPQLPDH